MILFKEGTQLHYIVIQQPSWGIQRVVLDDGRSPKRTIESLYQDGAIYFPLSCNLDIPADLWEDEDIPTEYGNRSENDFVYIKVPSRNERLLGFLRGGDSKNVTLVKTFLGKLRPNNDFIFTNYPAIPWIATTNYSNGDKLTLAAIYKTLRYRKHANNTVHCYSINIDDIDESIDLHNSGDIGGLISIWKHTTHQHGGARKQLTLDKLRIFSFDQVTSWF